ncbi:MAG: hypothetical protein LC126_09320 [Bryobacterales bacterium]|nr:hypothetical protein [Bryobacterales bacterium]
METVWLRPPHGEGDPKEFEAKPEILIPAMNAGWSQCAAPAAEEEVTEHVG